MRARKKPEGEPLAVSVSEVGRLFGVSRGQIYRLMKAGRFPKPIRLGTMSPRWSVAELKAFAEKGGAIHGK